MRNPSQATVHVDDDFLLDLAHGLIVADAAGTGATARDPRLEHLRSCASCDRRFQEQVTIRERLRAEGPPGHAEAAAATIGAPARQPADEVRRSAAGTRSWALAALVAAAALAALLIAPLVLRPREPGLPDYWLPLDRGELSTRAGSADPIADLRLAFRRYEQRDAAGALALLERAELPESQRPLRDLFRASALLHLDRAAQARALLETMPIVAMPQPWRDRAGWLLYESLVRTGDGERAKTQLAALAELPGEIGDLARAHRDGSAPASR